MDLGTLLLMLGLSYALGLLWYSLLPARLPERVDLVMELRESQASRYTERETPIFTCVRMAPAEALRVALGLEAVDAGERERRGQVSLIARG